MRFVAATLLIAGAILLGVLGGGFWLSSKLKVYTARLDAGDLSEAAGDLAPPSELERFRKDAEAKAAPAGQRHLTFGILLLSCVPLVLVASVLVMLRRAKLFVLAVAALGGLALIVVMALDGFMTLGAVTAGALEVAALAALFVRRRRPLAAAPATS